MDLRPHAVAFPFPSPGHINPMLQLCRALARQGFLITFVHTEDNFTRLQESVSDNDETDDSFRYETIPDKLAISRVNVFYSDNRLKFVQAVQEMKSELEELIRTKICLKGPPVSCLVLDVLFSSGVNLGKRIGIPLVSFWCSTASSLLLELHLPLLLEKGDVPVHDRLREKAIDYIPGLPPLPTWSLPNQYSPQAEVYDPGFRRKIQRVQSLKDTDFLLINTAEELEPAALQALKVVMNPNTFAAGSMTFFESKLKQVSKEDQDCLEWLDEQRPASVLYISFGSIAAVTKDQLQELTTGLKELGHPYLWALRRNAAEMKEEEFEELRNSVKASKGLLVNWSPQQEVLKHPATGGFVTHCGWNSTLESLWAGVPMLCLPLVAEQHMNCLMIVEEWRIGLRFSIEAISAGLVRSDEFVNVAGKLMGELGPELRANAMRLQQTLRKAVAAEGSSRFILQKLASQLMKKCQNS